jgi:hypothetical protein
MHFTDEDLKEFMDIYSAAFHEEISFAGAREMTSRVMRLYESLAEPLPSERRPSIDQHNDSDVF